MVFRKQKVSLKEELRKTKEKTINEENINEVITFRTTHKPRNPSLFQTIKNMLPILSAVAKLKPEQENESCQQEKTTIKLEKDFSQSQICPREFQP